MLVPYSIDDSTDHFRRHFSLSQTGGSVNVYRGRSIMTGRGIGSVFKGIFKSVIPIAKKLGIAAGKRLLETGTSVLNDVAQGKNLSGSLKSQFTKSGKDLLSDVRNALTNGEGSNMVKRVRETSKTPKKVRKRKLQSSLKPKPSSKRQKKDIFS